MIRGRLDDWGDVGWEESRYISPVGERQNTGSMFPVNVSRGGNQEVRLSAGGARVQGMASLIAKFAGGFSSLGGTKEGRQAGQGKAKQGIDKVRHWIMASWATSETLRAISGLRCRALSVVPLGSGGRRTVGAASGGPHLAALERCWSTAGCGMVAAPRWLTRAGRQAVGQMGDDAMRDERRRASKSKESSSLLRIRIC